MKELRKTKSENAEGCKMGSVLTIGRLIQELEKFDHNLTLITDKLEYKQNKLAHGNNNLILNFARWGEQSGEKEFLLLLSVAAPHV